MFLIFKFRNILPTW